MKEEKEKIENWEVRFCDIWADCKFDIEKLKKSCDFIRQEKQKLVEEIKKLKEALIWCSGSDDFQEGGKARKGWVKICVPLLTEKK